MKGFFNGLGNILGIGLLCLLSTFGGAVWATMLFEKDNEHHEKMLGYLNEDIKNLRKDKERLEEEIKILKEI